MSWRIKGKSVTFDLITDGLVLNLDAGDPESYPGSGTVWTDLSGNGNNGTLVNGVGYNSDNGGSLVFDGVNDYVDCGTGLNVSNLTISLWINFNSTSNQVFVTKGNWDTNQASYTFGYFNNQIRVDTFLNDSTYGTATYNFTPILNTWYNLNFISNSNNSTYSLYVNSFQVIGNTGNTYQIPRSGSYSVNIGRNTNGNYPLNGRISQVSIYNRALTPQEIQQNFNATRSRFGI